MGCTVLIYCFLVTTIIYFVNYDAYQHWNQVRSPGSSESHFVRVILDWITWDAKLRKHYLEAKQWLSLQCSLCKPRPLFEAMIFACCKCMESPTLYFFCAIYSLLRATPMLLQEFYRCSMPGNIHVQQAYSLHGATFTYKIHILVSATLRVVTPTNPLRYLFAYREYTLLGTCNALLTQFLSVFHSLPIWVTSGSDPDCDPGHQLSSCDPVSTLAHIPL